MVGIYISIQFFALAWMVVCLHSLKSVDVIRGTPGEPGVDPDPGGKSLPLCDASSMFIRGRWEFSNSKSDSLEMASYDACPGVKSHLTSSQREHLVTYLGRPFVPAHFVVISCKVFSFAESASIVSKWLGGRSLVFVGDSLTGQMQVGTGCALEKRESTSIISKWLGDRHHITIKNVLELTLLHGLRCHPTCVRDSEFRITKSHLCEDCLPDSKSDLEHLFPWLKRMYSTNVGVVVLNAAAWFLPIKGVTNATHSYQQMSIQLRPVLKKLAARKVVVWVNLLSINPLFQSFQQPIRSALKDTGVLFLDVADVSRDRIALDNRSTVDGQHHANPSDYGIPTFVGQSLLHILARHILALNNGHTKKKKISHRLSLMSY